MRQALHIFRKDVRYLWLEICFVLVLSAVSIWIGPWSRGPGPLEVAVTAGAAFVISRVVHAEAIPGDNQFWITRPYRWTSLLGAKLLFLVIFVNLPMFVARLVALVFVMGFPLGSVLPGLLWSQLLTFVTVALPVAALAAVTRGLVPFIFSAMGMFLIAYIVFGGSPAIWSVQWIWNSILVLTLTVAAVPVLYAQYKGRRTTSSRVSDLA